MKIPPSSAQTSRRNGYMIYYDIVDIAEVQDHHGSSKFNIYIYLFIHIIVYCIVFCLG